VPSVFSIGDALLGLGVFAFIQQAMAGHLGEGNRTPNSPRGEQ
jgi:hypothetical protein